MSISGIKNYLNQPAVVDSSFKESLKSGIAISVAIAFLVYIFFLRHSPLAPFQQIINSLAFGLITFCMGLLIDFIFYNAFPNWMAEKNWKVWKSLLYIIINFLAIAVANYIYMAYKNFVSYNQDNFLYVILYTFLIGIIPISMATLFRHNQQLKKRLAEAHKLNQQLSNTDQNIPAKKSSSTFVKLSTNSDTASQKELAFELEDFLFAVSEKNYVRFVFDQADDQQIRATIKAIEAQLTDHPQIIRTHRAFIVNTKKINQIEGNAQGYRLSFEGKEELALVSRSYVKAFRSFEF